VGRYALEKRLFGTEMARTAVAVPAVAE